MSFDLWRQQLAEAGAEGREVDELLAYNENTFDLTHLGSSPQLPLPDEPFVACWRRWMDEASRETEQGSCAFEVLRCNLPQLRFPIQEGISRSDDYRQATLQGVDPDLLEGATGLDIEQPETIHFEIYPSPAGGLPVIEVHHRQQFETLVRALSRRNEPSPVPPAMGAQMVSGFNNWSRIHELRQQWQDTPTEERTSSTWGEAFAVIRRQPELYQDRFALLSDGPYSAVAASELGLAESAWRAKSLIIRREHECTHYFTRRIFGSMRNHLLDELIADFAGIMAAEGRYRSDWFLRFMGLEASDRWRPDGRLALYRGEPALSDGAFRILQRLTIQAAEHLERFEQNELRGRHGGDLAGKLIIALAASSIIDLASEGGIERLRQSLA
jgi:hypothetical protein